MKQRHIFTAGMVLLGAAHIPAAIAVAQDARPPAFVDERRLPDNEKDRESEADREAARQRLEQEAQELRQRLAAEAAAQKKRLEEEAEAFARQLEAQTKARAKAEEDAARQKAEAAEKARVAAEAEAEARRKAEDEALRRKTEAEEKARLAAEAEAQAQAKARANAADTEEAKRFLERARGLLERGNIASARLVLERASEAGLADAAFLLAETYDATGLQRLGAIGISPNSELAKRWYERAAALGSDAAKARLKQPR